MSNFKPLNFQREVELKEYPSANDPKFKVPMMIKESFLDAERERKELEGKISAEAKKIADAEIQKIKKRAYEDGFEQGQKDSFKAIEDDRKKTISDNRQDFINVIQYLNDQKIHIFNDNMNFFFELIGEICKKVIGKYVEYDHEALGRWLVEICDELSKSEELAFHTTEKLKKVLEYSIEYLKTHRTNFPNLKIVVNQDVEQIIVESKKVDIIVNFNEQINSIISLIGYKDANT